LCNLRRIDRRLEEAHLNGQSKTREETMHDVHIVEERPPYLLLERNRRFAVVERRAGKLYSLHCGHRDAEPLTDAGAAHAVGDDGWCDERTARRVFEEVASRYHELAEQIR
jgi:hypothetical protein